MNISGGASGGALSKQYDKSKKCENKRSLCLFGDQNVRKKVFYICVEIKLGKILGFKKINFQKVFNFTKWSGFSKRLVFRKASGCVYSVFMT